MSKVPKVRHVGLNAIFLQPHMGGLEVYLRRLVPSLLEIRPDLRLSIFVNELGRRVLVEEPWSGQVELVTHPLLGRPYTRALSEISFLGLLASRRGVDVLQNLAMLGPLRTKAAQVLTVADVTWLRYPDPAEWVTRQIWRTLVPLSARRADRVLVFSEAARAQVAPDLHVPPERVDVVPLGPGAESSAKPTSEAELRSRLRLGAGPIVLSVGPVRAHKNLESLVESAPLVREQVPEATFVLAGGFTGHREALEERASELGVAEAVRLPGWVEDGDLEGLYRSAACFVLPSLNEGFGLPILEAMRRDVPVACSNVSSLPEVAGPAAEYFDPSKPEEIAAAIVKIVSDRGHAQQLIAMGREQQAKFTWRRAAEGTIAVYERAVAGR